MTTPATTTPANLVAFLGGVAVQGGARYKIEVRQIGGGYEARTFNAAAGANWTDQGVCKADADLSKVLTAALKKFGEKVKAGRTRVYTNPMPGTTSSLAVGTLGGMAGNDLPVHRLVWQAGRSLDTLPVELHRDAMILGGVAQTTAAPVAQQAARAVPQQASTSAQAAAPAQSGPVARTVAPQPAPVAANSWAYGRVLMHPNTIQTEPEMLVLLDDNRWVAQEKKEGRRAQLHRDESGRVFMTNRSGEEVSCPPHIAEAMEQVAPGTSLDCELIAEDAQGCAALYAGGTTPAFEGVYAFDLIRSPLLPDTMNTWFDVRVATLRRIIATINRPDAIRLIPTATGTAAKRRLLLDVRSRQGEGLVLRTMDAPYVDGRPNTCLRWRDRKREMDVVMLPYDFARGRWGFQAGTGKQTGMVGAIEVGLYDGSGVLRSVGEVGSGFSDSARGGLQQRWDAARTDLAQLEATAATRDTRITDDEQAAFFARNTFVVRVTCMGLTFNDQMIRPSALEVREAGDKQPRECTFLSEAGREWGTGSGAQQALAA